VFSKIDMRLRYYQLRIKELNVAKTALKTLRVLSNVIWDNKYTNSVYCLDE